MKLTCYTYTLPFSKPLQTSKQTFKHRRGFILSISIEKEFQFVGEVAPLPGFSPETHQSIQEILLAHQETLTKKLSNPNPVAKLREFYRDTEIPSSLQFGLDSLAYQLEAHKNNKSLLDYLFRDTNPQIPVNTLVSLSQQEKEALDHIKRKIRSGFNTIKCKVGLHVEHELELLGTIRAQLPDLKIRVDANQAWNLEEALEYCNQLQLLDIEYCEEPLVSPTPENMERLSQNTPLPLALDETTTQHSYWPNLLPFTAFLIIKPMVVGSYLKNIETKRLANTHNNKVVVTTSLESGVGRYFVNVMAAGLGSPNTAHGLSTGFLLSKDITAEKNVISDGFINLSSQSAPTVNFEQRDLFQKLFQ